VLAALIPLVRLPCQVTLLSEAPPGQAAEPRQATAGAKAPVAGGVPAGRALRSRVFLTVVLLFVVAASVPSAVRQTAESLFSEHGVGVATASLALSVLSVASVVGQLGIGPILDRFRSPLPSSWPRNGASGLRVRHDFPLLLFMIRGVVSPGPKASTDR
jgi:MFS family permease